MSVAVISWPSGHSPEEGYIVLGKIPEKYTEKMLEKLHEDLECLYPFKIGKEISNVEDIKILSEKYKLEANLEIKDTCKNISFHSPKIFDLKNMKPLFKNKYIPRVVLGKKVEFRIFIVLPHPDPVVRGCLLDTCLNKIGEYKPFFILVGGKYGKNKDSSSVLMTRYLLKRGVDTNIIVKNFYEDFPDCIMESLKFIPVLGMNNIKHNIMFSVQCNVLKHVVNYIRFVKMNKGFVDLKINTYFQFVCDW